MELVSVIVPVYNVVKYLNKCVDSLLEQDYPNYEIILVNDGSLDGSDAICDQYAQTYSDLIKVVHKANGGLSDARNVGISHAAGKYVVFVDSDDYVAKNYISYLYDLMVRNSADIGICNVLHCYDSEDNTFKEAENEMLMNSEEAIMNLLYQKVFLVSACGKIFPRSYFEQIQFPVGMLFEDGAIMYKLFDLAGQIACSDAQLYAYVHRENSLTTSKFSKRDLDILTICDQIEAYFDASSTSIKKAILAYKSSACMRIYLNAPDEEEFAETKKACELFLKKNAVKILKDKNARFKNRMAMLLLVINKSLLKYCYKRVDRWK